MTLRCVAIDDEPLALKKLQTFIDKIPDAELIATFSSCIEASSFLHEKVPDLLFLDIEMSELSGIDFIETMREKPHIVLISAYEKYALRGYELDVSDYILKPYGLSRLIKAIDKVRALQQPTVPQRDFIFVKTDHRTVRLRTAEILYVEGMRDYLCIHSQNGKTMTLLNYTELQGLLPGETFVRVHKSYLVNLAHIDSIDRHRIYIREQIIPIGQTYRERFYKLLGK